MALLTTVCIIGGPDANGYAKTMREKTEAACAEDAAKLCPAEAADPDRLKACLVQHRAAATPACMKLIDASE